MKIVIVVLLIVFLNNCEGRKSSSDLESKILYNSLICIGGIKYYSSGHQLAVYISEETLKPQRCKL